MKKLRLPILIAVIVAAAGCFSEYKPLDKYKNSVEVKTKLDGEVVAIIDDVARVTESSETGNISIYRLDHEKGRVIFERQFSKEYYSWKWIRPEENTRKKNRR